MATWEETRTAITSAYDAFEIADEVKSTIDSVLDDYDIPEPSDETKGLKEEIESLNTTIEALRNTNTTLLRMVGTSKKEDEPEEPLEKEITIEDVIRKELE